MSLSHYEISSSLSFSFVGPPLNHGPLPALFYFSLSAHDSLKTDPFNQPVQFLKSEQIRIFSTTIPGHEEGRDPKNALTFWAEKLCQGEDLLSPFFVEVSRGIEHMLSQEIILPQKWALAGLSRGAFVACHVAALCTETPPILGYAPLTHLSARPQFKEGVDVEYLNLEALTSKLYKNKIRFYIGNQDTCVGTDLAFHFIYSLAKKAKEHRIHSSPIELIIGPSIGYQGHGTPPSVFQAGVDWIKQEILK